MKVNCSIEVDSNEINAVINGVKDLLGFIIAQQKQDEIGRRMSDLEDHFRVGKVSKWWNEDTKQSKNCHE